MNGHTIMLFLHQRKPRYGCNTKKERINLAAVYQATLTHLFLNCILLINGQLVLACSCRSYYLWPTARIHNVRGQVRARIECSYITPHFLIFLHYSSSPKKKILQCKVSISLNLNTRVISTAMTTQNATFPNVNQMASSTQYNTSESSLPLQTIATEITHPSVYESASNRPPRYWSR